MLSLRIAGALLLTLCGWACGRLLVQRAVLRRRALSQCVLLLERLSQEVRCRRMDFAALLPALRRDSAFCELALADCTSLGTLMPPECLSAEQKRCFAECFGGLGHAMSQQESARLEYYAARFRTCLAQAEEQEKNAQRLYPRLCLGAGAMLAITLL